MKPTEKQLDAALALAEICASYGAHPEADGVLQLVAEVLGLCGVEAVTAPGGAVLSYANAGDPYAATVCHDSGTGELFVGDWGGWLEDEENEYADATGRIKCGHCGHWTPRKEDWRATVCESCDKLVSG